LTISRQMIEERQIQAPLSLNEARVSVTLAAVSGGMFELGDDLPTLGQDPDRLALVTNPDILQMVKLGNAAVPLDLLTYRPADEQPGIFLLREDSRQAMLAVFNWTEHPNSHAFSFSDLGLSPDHRYRVVDVFQPEQQLAFDSTGLRIENQPAHFVTLLKILDESIAARTPSVAAKVPAEGKVGEDLGFAAIASERHVPALAYHWDFGDGVIADGATLTHTYTREGSYTVHLRVEGADGLSFEEDCSVTVKGSTPLPKPKRGPVDKGTVDH
jgi:alpha-galactosidase